MENCQPLITIYLACMSSKTNTIIKEKCKPQYEQVQACIQSNQNPNK